MDQYHQEMLRRLEALAERVAALERAVFSDGFRVPGSGFRAEHPKRPSQATRGAPPQAHNRQP